MSDPTQEWVWSHEHQNYYRVALQNGEWEYVWAPQRRDSVHAPTTSYVDDTASIGTADLPPCTVRGTNGSYERLDPSYVVQNDAKNFFRPGRMFAVLFSEPMGETAANLDSENVTVVRYGERVFTNIRRFVVIRRGRGFCYACPVSTYGNRATTKPGLDPTTHAVVYTVDSEPITLYGETRMVKEPIAIVPENGARLSAASRINFALFHPIQHNVKVKNLGHVHEEDLPKLIAYWRMDNSVDDE